MGVWAEGKQVPKCPRVGCGHGDTAAGKGTLQRGKGHCGMARSSSEAGVMADALKMLLWVVVVVVLMILLRDGRAGPGRV